MQKREEYPRFLILISQEPLPLRRLALHQGVPQLFEQVYSLTFEEKEKEKKANFVQTTLDFDFVLNTVTLTPSPALFCNCNLMGGLTHFVYLSIYLVGGRRVLHSSCSIKQATAPCISITMYSV